jgi:hypothetical protein
MIQKHRISTNIGVDQKITVELKQDFDVLEILSLKFSQQEIYTSMCSDYGVVCGRVTANNGFGLGNVRVSIFVPLTTEDESDPVISKLYPYKEVTDKDENHYRYNLLPSRQQHSGHANTGTFPDQSDILTREEVLEVYEKYYKYTVKTNSAGDFMIWGVPIGAQTIHMDADLSDVGCFSLRPYDFIRQGKGVDNFKNKYTFNASEDVDSLPQIVSMNRIIQVYPFWGNESLCEIGITRTDFDLTEKGVNIQPKAYVIGGIFTDSSKNAINKNCTPRRKMGRKCDMVAKSGKIEAIRFTQQKDENHHPYLEVVDLHEDIPDDGGFVLPLEMNMDYVITNEFGENEITNDPNKGVPTSACYRFRINMNDKDLSRVRFNADYLLPNIREYQEIKTLDGIQFAVPDDRSYAFSTDFNDYPPDAIPLILNNEGGEYYPQDYFYRFTYNKVYTVSSFQQHYFGSDLIGRTGFANINEAHPSEEEDCGDKLTPPTNFAVKHYTFSLLIADVLLFLDYIFNWIVLIFLNSFVKVARTMAEGIISAWANDTTRGLRGNINDFMADNVKTLNLVNYPECEECAPYTENNGCEYYDIPYDDSIITGYFVEDLTYTSTDYLNLPNSFQRKYKTKSQLLSSDKIVAVAIYGGDEDGAGGSVPSSYFPYNSSTTENKGVYDGNTSGNSVAGVQAPDWGDLGLTSHTEYYYNGHAITATKSRRSEFSNGVYTVVPGTQSNKRLSKILGEYYRRKRVGKMFCGGIVNYGFIDNWLSGSLYFFQFKAKNVSSHVETSIKYCRGLVRFVGNGVNRFYYRSARFINNNFVRQQLNHPTTFVDLGPRDEFIKEICIDQTLDPNCSVSRSIGPTSYQDIGELLGMAINYRMDIAGADGNLDMFFANQGFQKKIQLNNILDGDILQLLSINNEAGIEPFDLQNPKYVAYQYNVLDPEFYPKVFQLDSGVYGPLPVTFDLKQDGERIRACLNEPSHIGYDGVPVQGRLTESSQPVPFYLWDKLGTGFGPYNEFKNDQAWDYSTVQVQPLQGMTFAYNITGVPNDSTDKYLLLPMTYTFSGLTISGNTVDEINFDIIDQSGTDNHDAYNLEYPGFTYLYVTQWGYKSFFDGSGRITYEPIGGTLYTRYGSAGTDGIVGWDSQPWSSTVDYIIRKTQDYYDGHTQILSTPFQFYFGLMAGKTGMDKFVDLFGPKGAFNLPECNTTPPPLNNPTVTPTPTPMPTASGGLPATAEPTPTPTYYWLKMLRCDEDPTLNIYHYSKNSFLSTSIQRGNLFRGGSNGLGGSPPAGYYYYTVVDLLLTNPNPITNGDVEGSKSVAPYALTCGDDPTHYIAPTYRTAHINLFGNTGFTSYQQFITDMYDKQPFQFSSGFTSNGAYADATVTGTTLTPGILYDLYQSRTDGTPKWTNSGSHYWGAIVKNTNSKVDYIIRIVDGTITEWYDGNGNLVHYP